MKRQHQNLGHGSYLTIKLLVFKSKLEITWPLNEPILEVLTQSRLIGLAFTRRVQVSVSRFNKAA
jgi:hypothetical protein